jgi:hypothetical protein
MEGKLLAADVQKSIQTSDGCTERHTHETDLWKGAQTSEECMENRARARTHTHNAE